MKPEISDIFGKTLQQQVSTLLDNLSGMTDIIEANFSQIKDILKRHKDELINAITQKNEKEITELKQELKVKDIEIYKLKQKEGELKGKDDMIAKLSADIAKLPQQFAFAHNLGALN